MPEYIVSLLNINNNKGGFKSVQQNLYSITLVLVVLSAFDPSSMNGVLMDTHNLQ